MESRYVELGLGKRHGFVSDMARRTGVLRSTLHNWFAADATPRLDALEEIARVLQVTRADLVAAFDGTHRRDAPAQILSDDERRRRRKWWLQIARLTTPLDLTAARAAFEARAGRNERNLIALWEDYGTALMPAPQRLRQLADVYRIPFDELADLWNNPPPTDEEEMATRRGQRLELVEDAEQPEAAPETAPETRRRSA